MRVTLVTETYFPQVNGVSRTLGQLHDYLERNGDSVQLAHPDYGRPLSGDEDVVARSISLPFYKELRLPFPPFRRVARAIDAFRPDIVHIATEATLGLSVLRHASRTRIPVVSSFHTNFDQYSSHYHVGFARGLIWRYLRWFHNATRETYVPSRDTIATLERRGFERLVLWPRGVDATLFRPDRPGRATLRARYGFAATDVVVAYVGRIAPEKNLGYLRDALVALGRRCPNVRFLLVGDGPSRDEAENLLGRNAVFAGYRSGEDLADHYATADLFAFASLTETFGNVVLEAMASGLPVVALRAGGVGEIVRSNETGELLDPDEPPGAFATRLAGLVCDGPRRRRMAATARAHAERQSWDEINAALRDCYARVLESVARDEPAARVDQVSPRIP